jgi:hypothetical protein
MLVLGQFLKKIMKKVLIQLLNDIEMLVSVGYHMPELLTVFP